MEEEVKKKTKKTPTSFIFPCTEKLVLSYFCISKIIFSFYRNLIELILDREKNKALANFIPKFSVNFNNQQSITISKDNLCKDFIFR